VPDDVCASFVPCAIRLADLHGVDWNGGWTPIDPGVLTTVEVDGERHGPFHVPRSLLQLNLRLG
jgi:hypothetical protein